MSSAFLGMHISAEFTEAFNPFFILALSPLTSLLWPWLAKRNMNPSYPMKFALGALFMGFGMLLQAFGIKFFSHNGISSAYWLFFSYGLQTIGELVLSPIGLAMITRLTPRKYVGMMMGVWFLALAAANLISGELATLADLPKAATILQSQHIYAHAFFDYGWLGLGLTAFTLLFVPKLKRMIAI